METGTTSLGEATAGIRLSGGARPLLRVAFAVLLLLTLWPAFRGWRLITAYARIPAVALAPVRELRLERPGLRRLGAAEGLALRSDGALFVAEPSRGRVLAFPDGTSASGAPLLLRGRFDVAAGPEGTLALLEEETGQLTVVDRAGHVVRRASVASGGARVLASDAWGDLYVSDGRERVVRKLCRDLTPDLAWGRGGAPGTVPLDGVAGLATRGHGLVAASRTENALLFFDAAGRLAGRTPLLGNAGRLLVAPGGRLLMTDAPAHRVWVLDSSGAPRARLTSGGRENAFASPHGIALDAEGRLWLANEGRVAVFRLPAAGLP